VSEDRLFELLPAVYRDQDAEEGDVLRALLRIVTEQVDVVEGDVARLYDDLFIETCDPWVVPYIGDLVGNDPLRDAVRSRADVAKTIPYRRRKGTLPMLEELARDVTGWAAHAVEFLELVGWSQHLEHIRPQAANFDVRSLERDDRVGGAFDEATRTVDVRAVSQHDGWHHHRHVGFFLWRLGSYPLRDVGARRASAAWRFHFSPLGNAAPMFSRERREGDEAGLATELHVPTPIRRAFFRERLGDLYDTPANPEASIDVTRNGTHVPPGQVICARLDPWPATRPAGNVIAIDVAVGRLAVGAGFTGASRIDVDYVYGFPADLGGGPYERRGTLARSGPGTRFYLVRDGVAPFSDVAAALAQWVADGRPDAVIRILDSRTYTLPATVKLRDDAHLTIEADNGRRPLLLTAAGGLRVDADGTNPDPEVRGRLALSGVVVEGFVRVTGDLRALWLIHATLIPGRSIEDGVAPGGESLRVDGAGPINTHLEVGLDHAIAGALVIPATARVIRIDDSIVDGAIDAGAATAATTRLEIERSTVTGRTNVRELEAGESIFAGRVDSAQTQAGCVRFSFVPFGSRTPRRHRCQPDLAIRARLDEALAANPAMTAAEQDALRAAVVARMVPSFTASQYGQPAFLQLRMSTPAEIRIGAADGSEMGAYCLLKQPQRESNLRTRLEEYLPFGLESGPIYIT
jgi:hypothetical protein